MNKIRADLSWWEWRMMHATLRGNHCHEYQPGLCCPVELRGGAVWRRTGVWCACRRRASSAAISGRSVAVTGAWALSVIVTLAVNIGLHGGHWPL